MSYFSPTNFEIKFEFWFNVLQCLDIIISTSQQNFSGSSAKKKSHWFLQTYELVKLVCDIFDSTSISFCYRFCHYSVPYPICRIKEDIRQPTKNSLILNL